MLRTFKNNISVIIVSYKSWHLLQSCLDSLLVINSNYYNLEVIVIDNSLDNLKIKNFESMYPEFNFFLNSGNNGFANGCNLGAEKANGDYFLFLNPDTKVTEKPILEMYKLLYTSKLAAVSCLQKNNNGSFEKSIRFFPKLSTLFGVFRAVFQKKLNSVVRKEKNIIYPDWVSGSVVLVSRYWFKKINGWNEDYWMYFEDVDFSKKIRNLGGEIGVITNTHISHNHGGSSRINIKTTSITKLEVIISKHVYVRNHFKGFNYVLLQALLVISTLISKLFFGLVGLFFFYLNLKLKLQFILLKKLLLYYLQVLKNKTWLSSRSLNYRKS